MYITSTDKTGALEAAYALFYVNNLTMSNFLVGWVKSAKSGLFATNPVSLLDYPWIAESLNPTSGSTLSRQLLYKKKLIGKG